jgi:hypothetical protein
MKKNTIYVCGILLIAGLAACNGTTSTTSSTDSTAMNRGDSSVTTTTTTTVVHHKYMGTFVPRPDVRYIDLRTHKQVTVRIDTVVGAVVNSETNEPLDLFVAPNSTDTFYGPTGTLANNHISINDAGELKVDTVNIAATEVQTVTPPPDGATPVEAEGKYKEKDNGNKKKLKTGDEKIKERNGIIKEKDR